MTRRSLSWFAKLCLSDGCRLRPRVSDRWFACGARPVLAVMPGWGAPLVFIFVGVFGYLFDSSYLFRSPLVFVSGRVGLVVCCEVVVCASRGAGSVAVY